MFVREISVTVIDFETTGSVPGFDNEPWQVGGVTLCNGRVDPNSVFESLIRVDINRPFNAYSPGKHHLLRESISVAEEASQVWKKIEQRLTGGPLAAHNASVEKNVLRRIAPMHRLGPWIDTLSLARKAWPGAPSCKLEDLTEGLGLGGRVLEICPGRQAHDALYDAVCCAALLEHLLTLPGWEQMRII